MLTLIKWLDYEKKPLTFSMFESGGMCDDSRDAVTIFHQQ